MTTINIIHGDSYRAMESMDENKYQLAICDVPYGINQAKSMAKKSNKKYGKSAAFNKEYKDSDWDNATPSIDYFNTLYKISNNQILWGANYFPDMLKPSMGWIYWDKKIPETNGFSDGELAYTSFAKHLMCFKYMWNGMLQEDMKNKEIRIHVTQKPIALYKWLLKNYAKPGDKIFDSHGGSMSHAIACIDMGFDLDIYELDKDYYDSAVKRIKNYVAQTDLSRPPVQINYITL